MLAYAANRPVPGKRQSSPNALLIVISVHVALLALVMSAKMDLPQRIKNQPTIVEFFPRPAPPQPVKPSPAPRPQNSTRLANPQRDVPLPPTADQPMDTGPTTIDLVPVGGGGAAVFPMIPKSLVTPVHHDPRLLTPPAELKPPYPPSKLLSEEEATLRLRLTIDESGRVAAVDPVGSADPVFLEAARRYLMAHWRYQPASENGRTIVSSMVITLKFQLDG